MNQGILEEIWQEFAKGFAKDIEEIYDPEKLNFVRFRGYNQKSINEPHKRGEISLWIRIDGKVRDNTVLANAYKAWLNSVWRRVLKEMPELNRIMFIPRKNDGTYTPGVHCEADRSEDNEVYFPS